MHGLGRANSPARAPLRSVIEGPRPLHWIHRGQRHALVDHHRVEHRLRSRPVDGPAERRLDLQLLLAPPPSVRTPTTSSARAGAPGRGPLDALTAGRAVSSTC